MAQDRPLLRRIWSRVIQIVPESLYGGHMVFRRPLQQRADGGFIFQVQRVNDGAGAQRLPGAWQRWGLFSGAW